MKKKSTRILPLDKYINECLYDRNNGYYLKKNPFGKKGDFITSPNISILFSEMISVWIVMFWKNINFPKKLNLVELGGGNGELIYQINKSIKKFPECYKSLKFYMFEKSNNLIAIQKKKFIGTNFKWVKKINDLDTNCTLFIGNEFLDAFAIKQFERKKNVWYEKYIKEYDSSNKIIDKRINIKIIEKKIGINISKDQNFIEVSLEQVKFINEISKFLNKNNGGILLIDYGYTNKKMFNSLQGVRNHKFSDFLKDKGNTDITHLINFDLLKKVFLKNKLEIGGITNQGDFLKRMGIFERAEIIARNTTFLKKADVFYRLKRITDKKLMGELFKVIFAKKKNIKFNYGFVDDKI